MKQNNYQKKQQNQPNYLKSMIIPTVIGLCLLVTYITTKDMMVKILCIFITFSVLIPFSLQLLQLLLVTISKTGVDKPRDVNDILKSQSNNKIYASELIHNSNTNVITQSKKVTNKGKVNSSIYYPRLRDTISSCSKNKLFTRQDILKLKSEIDYCLGTRKYIYDNNFIFENDLHEIYIKIKSSVLKDKDYEHLLQVVNEIVEKNTEDVI